MILLLFSNCILVYAAFLLVAKSLKPAKFTDSLLAVSIIYYAQIIFTELTLGIIGLLALKNVIFLNLSIALSIVMAVRHRPSFFYLPRLKDLESKLLEHRVVVLAASAILVFGIVKVFINLVNPPFGWDSLNYHFTFAVEWLKHGNLGTPITIFDDPGPTYYPINGSLLFLWLIFPLKNVFLADLAQLPFFIISALALFSICRKLQLNREKSFYASALFLLIPNFFKQLQIAYVDVMITGFFLVAVNYLLLLNEEFNLQNTVIYSLSLGLLLGTKTIGLPYGILLFIPFFYLLLKHSKKAYLILVSLFLAMIFGGFAYIRNFYLTGNPIYPLDFKLFGNAIFKGVIDSAVYGAHFTKADYALTKLLFHEGLGVQTLLFVLPAIFLSFPVIILKHSRKNTLLLYLSILPLLIYLAFRFIIPLANTRYLYPLLGLGMVMGFYIFTRLKLQNRLVNALVFLSVLASLSELAKRAELTVSLVGTFLLFFLAFFFLKYRKAVLLKPLLKPLAVICILAFIACLILLERFYIKNEYPRYLKMVKYSGFWPDAAISWDWLNSHTKGNNIAYTGRPVAFPLYGSGFKNNVYYVSINNTDPAMLHYFANSRYVWGHDFESLHKSLEERGNYREMADFSTWVKNLKRRRTDFLFVYSLHQTKQIEFPLEDSWALEHPEKFLSVFRNDTIHIYRCTR